MASVILQNVKKVYEDGFVAVHGINLEVKDKEFVVLVGPSGCGKSTTLRMIAGLEDITEGTIRIDERVVNDVAPKDRDIAMVFQNYALYPHMTVYDNMAFGLTLRKFPKKEVDARVREAAAILGLDNYLDKKPKVLSGGQRQRVAVGRAIVRKPKVFLFDEPLSNLDAKLRVQMRMEISKLHRNLGATMIYVTHDQTEAMTMGERIVLMKDGVVQQIDTPLKIYDRPVNKFTAGFIGTPAMNFLDGRIIGRKSVGFKETGDGLSFTVPAAMQKLLNPFSGKNMTMGVRPENIYLKSRSAGIKRPLTLRANVEAVEPMGNETYLYFSTRKDGSQHVARVRSSEGFAVGKPVNLLFDLEKAHFFDSVTEMAVLQTGTKR
ncbi:MAG: sn-glycerol-3-phosphate ABC transporter ATP-binding protein UgpC [Bacteroidota bacterium]